MALQGKWKTEGGVWKNAYAVVYSMMVNQSAKFISICVCIHKSHDHRLKRDYSGPDTNMENMEVLDLSVGKRDKRFNEFFSPEQLAKHHPYELAYKYLKSDMRFKGWEDVNNEQQRQKEAAA